MKSFTVATLNIWNRFGPWDERLPIIREEVARLLPDVLTMQEVLRTDFGDCLDQAAVIGEGFGYSIAYGRAPDSLYPFGNAILSRWPIKDTQVFTLPHGGGDEIRNLLYAELEAPFGKLRVFTTHLNWKLNQGAIRMRQMRFVVDTIESLSPENDFPPVLTGDFNAESDADEIRYLRGLTYVDGKSIYFADCYANVGDRRSGATYARRNSFAATCREPDRRIDYIFVRGADDRYRGEPIEAKICFDVAKNEIWASDHFGVWARIATA